MLVYSDRIADFIHEIRQMVKHVLAKEVGLRVETRRFYDRRQRASYPINIVIYNHKTMLGYFDPNFYELGFHESLLYAKKEQLHQIIRHEIAHYMTFIEHGAEISPHGEEFRTFCKKMGWGEEIYSATICLEKESASFPESGVLRKVQKLLALATSANPHEAELAMIKSRQLLLKHNIEEVPPEEEKMFLKRIMEQKRETAKMRAIAKILETFFVSIVYRRTAQFTCLEILGTAVNVEIAEYVASVLDSELEKLLKKAPIKGLRAKNSFFLGVAKGYCQKVEALKKEYSQALMVIEQKLEEARALAYHSLSSTKRRGAICATSSALGEQIGRNLQIHPAVRSSHLTPARLFRS